MKKILSSLLLVVIFFFISSTVRAVDQININLPPITCYLDSCPSDLLDFYTQKSEKCVSTYDEFIKNPGANHYWIDDPEITAQGRADERDGQVCRYHL